MKIIDYAVKLTFLCILSSAILSFVYNKTMPEIERQEREKIMAAQKELLPQAETFESADDSGNFMLGFIEKAGRREAVGKIVSFETRGYAGLIKLMAGVNSEEKITGVKVLQQSETPGLGDRISKNHFLGQFSGRGYDELAFGAQGSGIQAITGATVSSRAVLYAVKQAMGRVQSHPGK